MAANETPAKDGRRNSRRPSMGSAPALGPTFNFHWPDMDEEIDGLIDHLLPTP
jgi:hypothetical protein